MRWTALVPLKASAARKSRLTGMLDDTQRFAISERMFETVIAALRGAPAIGEIVLLAPDRPPGWSHLWRRDADRGLNAELVAMRAETGAGDLLVVHADLPLLTTADIGALLDAATVAGAAIAPDRHGHGTNALAIRAALTFRPYFGDDSFARHVAHYPDAAIVRTAGLSIDLDTPDDLAFAAAHGFALPGASDHPQR